MSDHLRVGDLERDRAAGRLAEHAAQGRLDPEEHAERIDAVWTARTQGDLAVLFHDLPEPAVPEPIRERAGGGPRWRPFPFLPLVAVLVVLSVLTHLPLWIGIFVLGGGLFHRARRARRVAGAPRGGRHQEWTSCRG